MAMATKGTARAKKKGEGETQSLRAGRPSALLDTRVIYCGDNLEQLAKLLDGCVDLRQGALGVQRTAKLAIICDVVRAS